jgi:hypothetical protein
VDARSLRLPQRISIGLVPALDFCTVEPLVFGRSQVLDGVTDGFNRRRKAPVVLVATLSALSQEEFGGRLVVEGHGEADVLFVLEIAQRHCLERGNVALDSLGKLDDLLSNQPRLGTVRQLRARRLAYALRRL